MDRAPSIFTVTAVAIAAGLAAYAVYFDYKRRNDVDFRRKLSKSCIFFGALSNWSHIEKDRKRVKQSLAQEVDQAEGLDATHAALREALQVIKNEEGPKNVEEKEGYFMTQVGIGEQLAAQGPYLFFPIKRLFLLMSFVGSPFHLPAAMAFYRALKIYPNPADLLGIYQKTIIEPVFKVRHFQPLFSIVPYLNMYLSLL